MSCETCKKTDTIPCCLTTLKIEGITNLNESLTAYFRNVATNRLLSLPATSDGTGIVSIDVTDERFPTNQSIEFWLTLSSTSINPRITITIDDIPTDCLLLSFARVNEEDETIDPVSEYTIALV